MYYPAKVALLMMMVNPSTEVKDKLYAKLVLPFVERYRLRIDSLLDRGSKKARELWAVVWAYAMKMLRSLMAAVWFSQRDTKAPSAAAPAPSTALAKARQQLRGDLRRAEEDLPPQ